MIAKRNLIIALMVSACLLIALMVSVCLFSNASAAKNSAYPQIPQLKVVIAHSNEGYASSIKHLLESKGIKVETMPVASLNTSIIEPYDLIIITGSERRLGRADYVKESEKKRVPLALTSSPGREEPAPETMSNTVTSAAQAGLAGKTIRPDKNATAWAAFLRGGWGQVVHIFNKVALKE